MQARVRLAGCARNPLRRSCVSSARNASESAICRLRAQPSAEIACAKCRRECDVPGARATLCGDPACRVREMQARVGFAGCARNPLRKACRVREMQARVRSAGCARNPLGRSCVSSARHAGESDLLAVRATLCGDRACRVREMQARVRLAVRATLCGDRACRVREMQARVRLCSPTVVRGAICGAGR